MKGYNSILTPKEIELEVNKSIFIASSAVVETEEEASAFILQIKERYKDATHHCTAMIIGKDRQIQRYNDDHEPQGTAGMPMLEVLRREKLTNIIVVVTRYFGGTKLGASGLIRAYTKACSECIKKSEIITMRSFVDLRITFRYSNIGLLENYLVNEGIAILEKEFLEEPRFDITVDADRVDEVKQSLTNITSGQIEITKIANVFRATKNGTLIFPQDKF